LPQQNNEKFTSMSTITQNQNDAEARIEVLTSLLKHNCTRNNEHTKLLDAFQSVLFFREQINKAVKEDASYIGSDDFHKTYATFNSLKLELIAAISNL
jgi:hypothetical protein